MTITVEETTDRRMPKTRREFKLTEPYRLPAGHTRTYTAYSGITVTTCWDTNGENDFHTDLHYMMWSCINWGRKIFVPESWKGAQRMLRRLGDRFVTSPAK